MGPAGIELSKRERFKKITFSSNLLETPDWYKSIKVSGPLELKRDIFPISHLINWEVPDPGDYAKFSFLPI
jgi:hypothetical protein